MATKRPALPSQPFLRLSAVAWLLLWLNLNSGPWNLADRSGPWGQLNALRASVPLVILFLVMIWAATNRTDRNAPRFGFSSLRWLQIYSLLALAAGILSSRPAYALYFGLAHFLAVTTATRLFRAIPSFNTTRMWLVANLILTTLWAAAVIWVGRHIIFGGGTSAYGIYNELEEVAGMPMSRSSGIARFAAVPLICAAVMACRDRGGRRAIWFIFAVFFAFVMYRMQSRGALAGVSAALGCLGVLAPRRRGPPIVAGLGIVALLMHPSIRQTVNEYLLRGQDAAEFKSFTGRTYVWGGAGAALATSPIFGTGHFADRLLLGANAHNAVLSASLTAGVVGLMPFLLSWICAWRDGWRLWRLRASLPPFDQNLLLISGGLLVFFTIRSIPETTTAGFSADLLILLPVMAFLEEASRMAPSSFNHPPTNFCRAHPS